MLPNAYWQTGNKENVDCKPICYQLQRDMVVWGGGVLIILGLESVSLKIRILQEDVFPHYIKS